MTKSILMLMAWMPAALVAQGGAARIEMMEHAPWMAPRGQGGLILGKPLAGTETVQRTQVLADGTHMDTSGLGQFYRDDKGRMRSGNEQAAMIFDPVAGSTYALRPLPKGYRQRDIPAGATCWILTMNNGTSVSYSYDNEAGPATGGPLMGTPDGAETPITTPLPAQTVNGVWASGTRVTVNIPAGAAGNSQAIQIVREQWYSADLDVLLQSTVSDPRYGTTTYNLTQVQQGAQDASLFQLPPDYVQLPSGSGAISGTAVKK